MTELLYVCLFAFLFYRQGHVNEKVPVEVLIEKYLRLDQREVLIPIATSGNVVIPKKRWEILHNSQVFVLVTLALM